MAHRVFLIVVEVSVQRVRTADPQNGNIPVQKRTKCEDTPKRALDGKRTDGLHGKISTAVERKIERRQKDACMGSDRRGAGFYGRAFEGGDEYGGAGTVGRPFSLLFSAPV
jgi:hypothetical protein